VRVDNSRVPNSRWYSGSGIYRHVRLVTTNAAHVDHWGTYITTPEVTAQSARVRVRTTVRNESPDARRVTVRTVVYDAAGKVVIATSWAGSASPDSTAEFVQELMVQHPQRWSLRRPYLHRAVTRVECGGVGMRRLHDALRDSQLLVPSRQRVLPTASTSRFATSASTLTPARSARRTGGRRGSLHSYARRD